MKQDPWRRRSLGQAELLELVDSVSGESELDQPEDTLCNPRILTWSKSPRTTACAQEASDLAGQRGYRAARQTLTSTNAMAGRLYQQLSSSSRLAGIPTLIEEKLLACVAVLGHRLAIKVVFDGRLEHDRPGLCDGGCAEHGRGHVLVMCRAACWRLWHTDVRYGEVRCASKRLRGGGHLSSCLRHAHAPP